MSETKVIRCNTVSIYTYGGGKGCVGVRWGGCQRAVLTRILQNIQEGISVNFLSDCAARVRGACSLFLEEGWGAANPIHRSSCDDFIFFPKRIHQMGHMQLSACDVCVCVWCGCCGACAMLVGIIGGCPRQAGRPLLEVGVVRKGIDVLLDHLVAELILLLWREGDMSGASFIENLNIIIRPIINKNN